MEQGENKESAGARARKNQLHVYLDDKELAELRRKMTSSGLNASQLIRAAVLGKKVQARPTKSYTQLYKELYLTCNNINQIAKLGNISGGLDTAEANAAIGELTEMISRIKGG
jgi:hypothetical protein